MDPLENLATPAVDTKLTTMISANTSTVMPPKQKGPAKAPPRKKAKPTPNSPKADSAADKPVPRSPSPPHDSSREPSSESSPKGRRDRGKNTLPTPQSPGTMADATTDEPDTRSPSLPPHNLYHEPSPESRSSRSSSVSFQASADSNATGASNAASVPSTTASTSTVASVSSKAKMKAGTKKNTSSLTLQEKNQMVDWLEDNPILWNTLMTDYKCRDKKKKMWDDQAALMGKSYDTIFTWYTSARDTHTKLLKTKSGSGAQRLTERESWLLERFKFRKVVQRIKAAPMESLKSTIEACAGDLEAAEAACAEVGATSMELETPIPTYTSSRKQRRPQEDPGTPLLSTPRESVQQSGKLLKDLAAQRHNVMPNARSAFANYVKDSLLSMSDKKYKTARRDINKVLSDLMLVDSDEEDMEIPPMRPTLANPNIPRSVQPCSAPAFGAVSSPSPSEQYQPMPATWKHQPPPSLVWNSRTPEYMQRYFQQSTQNQQSQQYQMLPPPTHTIMQSRQNTQQPSSTVPYMQQLEEQQQPSPSSSYLLDGSLPSLVKEAERPMNTPAPPPSQDQ